MNDNKSIHQNNNFGVEHVPKEIKEFVGNKNIKANIFEYKQAIQ